MSDDPKICGKFVSWWDGEYEGNCELVDGHDTPHWDGLSWFDDDLDEVNAPDEVAMANRIAALRSEVERLTRELGEWQKSQREAVANAGKLIVDVARLTRERNAATVILASEKIERLKVERERDQARAERDSLSSQLAEARAKLGEVSGE